MSEFTLEKKLRVHEFSVNNYNLTITTIDSKNNFSKIYRSVLLREPFEELTLGLIPKPDINKLTDQDINIKLTPVNLEEVPFNSKIKNLLTIQLEEKITTNYNHYLGFIKKEVTETYTAIFSNINERKLPQPPLFNIKVEVSKEEYEQLKSLNQHLMKLELSYTKK